MHHTLLVYRVYGRLHFRSSEDHYRRADCNLMVVLTVSNMLARCGIDGLAGVTVA